MCANGIISLLNCVASYQANRLKSQSKDCSEFISLHCPGFKTYDARCVHFLARYMVIFSSRHANKMCKQIFFLLFPNLMLRFPRSDRIHCQDELKNTSEKNILSCILSRHGCVLSFQNNCPEDT